MMLEERVAALEDKIRDLRRCLKDDGTAIAAHCVAPNTYEQQTIALEGRAANAPVANVVLVVDGKGLEVATGVSQVLVGQLGGPLRPLWP